MVNQRSFLEKLIDFSLHHKFWVIFFSLFFLGFTIYKVNELTIDAVPDITNVQVMINTKTRGLDPEKVELTVTQPIEYEMMGIPDLVDMRSISKFGLSQVTLIFKDNTNIYWARQQVSEKLQSALGQLPNGVQPELAPISTGLGEVYMYGLNLKKDSPLINSSHQDQMLYLREIQDWVVRPSLRKIKDVADVDSNGGYKKELHINIDPKKMISFGLTLDKIREKLQGLGESFGGGSVTFGKEALIIKASTVQENVEDFQKIILGQMYNGKKIHLSDVAIVSLDAAPRLGSATFMGEETVLGTILMKSGGNGRVVSLDVEQAIKELKLPADVEIKQLYSRAFLVNTTLHTVIKNLSEGAILVVIILLLLLGHLRAALIVSLVIPVSMLGTTLGMQGLGLSGNLMSLGAIDFGLVVDGAVVLVESLIAGFAALTPEERKNLSKDAIVSSKGKDVMRPVIFGVGMIMLVYLPILLLEGVEGKMFRPMAWTVLLTLGWSLLLTVFLVPVLVSLFVPVPEAGSHEDETFFFRKIKNAYSPLLLKTLDHARPLMIGGILIIAIAGFVSSRMGSDFIPQLDEGDIVFNLTRNSRISLNEALDEQYRVDEIIKA
ncbi:MAG: efflux RND transporter permease subunit, partial [Bacteriovoracaceae bacterium]